MLVDGEKLRFCRKWSMVAPPPNPLFLLIKKIFTVQVIFLLKWEIEISYIDFVDCSQSLTHTGYCVVID